MKIRITHIGELGLLPTLDLDREYDLELDRLFYDIE